MAIDIHPQREQTGWAEMGKFDPYGCIRRNPCIPVMII